MKYLMLIYGNEDIWYTLPAGERADLIDRVDAFNRALTESGEMVSVEGLISQPKSIRPVDGDTVVIGAASTHAQVAQSGDV